MVDPLRSGLLFRSRNSESCSALSTLPSYRGAPHDSVAALCRDAASYDASGASANWCSRVVCSKEEVVLLSDAKPEPLPTSSPVPRAKEEPVTLLQDAHDGLDVFCREPLPSDSCRNRAPPNTWRESRTSDVFESLAHATPLAPSVFGGLSGCRTQDAGRPQGEDGLKSRCTDAHGNSTNEEWTAPLAALQRPTRVPLGQEVPPRPEQNQWNVIAEPMFFQIPSARIRPAINWAESGAKKNPVPVANKPPSLVGAQGDAVERQGPSRFDFAEVGEDRLGTAPGASGSTCPTGQDATDLNPGIAMPAEECRTPSPSTLHDEGPQEREIPLRSANTQVFQPAVGQSPREADCVAEERGVRQIEQDEQCDLPMTQQGMVGRRAVCISCNKSFVRVSREDNFVDASCGACLLRPAPNLVPVTREGCRHDEYDGAAPEIVEGRCSRPGLGDLPKEDFVESIPRTDLLSTRGREVACPQPESPRTFQEAGETLNCREPAVRTRARRIPGDSAQRTGQSSQRRVELLGDTPASSTRLSRARRQGDSLGSGTQTTADRRGDQQRDKLVLPPPGSPAPSAKIALPNAPSEVEPRRSARIDSEPARLPDGRSGVSSESYEAGIQHGPRVVPVSEKAPAVDPPGMVEREGTGQDTRTSGKGSQRGRRRSARTSEVLRLQKSVETAGWTESRKVQSLAEPIVIPDDSVSPVSGKGSSLRRTPRLARKCSKVREVRPSSGVKKTRTAPRKDIRDKNTSKSSKFAAAKSSSTSASISLRKQASPSRLPSPAEYDGEDDELFNQQCPPPRPKKSRRFVAYGRNAGMISSTSGQHKFDRPLRKA